LTHGTTELSQVIQQAFGLARGAPDDQIDGVDLQFARLKGRSEYSLSKGGFQRYRGYARHDPDPHADRSYPFVPGLQFADLFTDKLRKALRHG
jgi:hypothetical protein